MVLSGLDDTHRPSTPTADRPIGAGNCLRCGSAVEGTPNFCPQCGAALRPEAIRTVLGSDQLIDKRYRVVEKLGEGGMGAVYKVEHTRMGKIAALKVMRSDFAFDAALKSRFLQEAQVVARLSHPNTVQVFDTGELDDGSLFITMEFVPGKDLAWHLKTDGPMSEGRAATIGSQLLASLQEAHEAGIVHRDIKPANVVLVKRKKGLADEQVKLLDFGIAKLQEAEGWRSTTGDFVGTPAYMSPEQIRGEPVDARSDLYSVGVLLFELVTGREVFVGKTTQVVINHHLSSPVPKVVEALPTAVVSTDFEAVLLRALEKDPSRRFKDADAMRAALEAFRRRIGLSTGELTPPPHESAEGMLSREDFERYERRLRLERTMYPLAVLGALLLAIASTWAGVEFFTGGAPRYSELEPNDVVERATPIALGTTVTGSIGSAIAGQHDRDVYVVQVPEGRVNVSLSGVDDLNLVLELSQIERVDEKDKLRRKVFLDELGPSNGERLDALAVKAGPLYLRIDERPYCTELERSPRERALVHYSLTVNAWAGTDAESEPNDTAGTAQTLLNSQPIEGFVGARVDDVERKARLRPEAPFSVLDWYRIEVPAGEEAQLLVVPPLHGALAVHDGDALETWRQKVERVTARSSTPPMPAATVVRSTPRLIKLEGTNGAHRIRINPLEDTVAGEHYWLAVLTRGASLQPLLSRLNPAQVAQVLEVTAAVSSEIKSVQKRADEGNSK